MDNRRKSFFRFVIFIVLVVAAILSAYFLSRYMFTTMEVEGKSMVPTLQDKAKIIIYQRGRYRTGDVIVFNSGQKDSDGRDRMFVKRIIGLPGDEIEIKRSSDDKLYIYRNNKKIEEKYIPEEIPHALSEMGAIKVEEGEFFFLGDNRLGSYDSRQGLMGKISHIKGRVVLQYTGNNMFNSPKVIKRIKNQITFLAYA